jgi:hypothetical protein
VCRRSRKGVSVSKDMKEMSCQRKTNMLKYLFISSCPLLYKARFYSAIQANMKPRQSSYLTAMH